MRLTKVLTAALICSAILLSPLAFWGCAGDDNITYETEQVVVTDCVPNMESLLLRVIFHRNGDLVRVAVATEEEVVLNDVLRPGDQIHAEWKIGCE